MAEDERAPWAVSSMTVAAWTNRTKRTAWTRGAAAVLEARDGEALVQAGAARAAGEERFAAVFKLEAAHGAAEHVAKGGALPALALVFAPEPEREDRAEHHPEEDHREHAEADLDHFAEAAGAVGRA